MITISLRMDKKRVAALLLALGLIGAGAAGIREKLVQQVMQSSSISARKVNPAAANEQQRRDFMAGVWLGGAGGTAGDPGGADPRPV